MTDKEVEEAKTLGQEGGKKSQDPKARRKVSDFMCHDTKTADRFYEANPNHSEAAEVRALVSQSPHQGPEGEREQHQEGEDEEEVEGGSSSSSIDRNTTPVMYQESGDSSCSSP
ncbi:Hypothetical protein SMAX5B_015349 [Scophthalmus maximus]|uniref:Uncharacterized protein n=1 Tax=Scophthalmus maximus TaxID=52904 RepID=A0A2U9CCG8_SCOMX|nr:Hypothetical protein SMAX5B_015349 [Scophthalmus maximus]